MTLKNSYDVILFLGGDKSISAPPPNISFFEVISSSGKKKCHMEEDATEGEEDFTVVVEALGATIMVDTIMDITAGYFMEDMAEVAGEFTGI